MNTTPDAVACATDLRPYYQGAYAEITTVVTGANADKGLGEFGQPVTVRGTIYRAVNPTHPDTGRPVTLLRLRVNVTGALMEFTLGRRNPARLFPES